MPYLDKVMRRKILNEISDHLYKMFIEMSDTGQGKFINYVICRAALKAVKERNSYEHWREVKSVLTDIKDEFTRRMGEYEAKAKERNGDIV